jgi:DMSO/TMAO reductase YedYZ molybdopterin-dependent catalytic subunit
VARILTRRNFLAGAAAASLLAGCDSRAVTGLLNAMQKFNGRFSALLYSPNHLAPELPASVQTPEDAFPQYYISDDLPLAPSDWRLKVGGLIRNPGVWTVADLQRMPGVRMRVRHHCVEGWSAVAQWQGVQVSEIARRVGLDPRVRFVEFRSFDSDYWSSWDLASALHPQTILAYGMNGHPLGAEHGAPLRLYATVKLGYKMVKYLTEVNFLPERTGGYWEDQGYDWFAGV